MHARTAGRSQKLRGIYDLPTAWTQSFHAIVPQSFRAVGDGGACGCTHACAATSEGAGLTRFVGSACGSGCGGSSARSLLRCTIVRASCSMRTALALATSRAWLAAARAFAVIARASVTAANNTAFGDGQGACRYSQSKTTVMSISVADHGAWFVTKAVARVNEGFMCACWRSRRFGSRYA
jgi:hypothetical protein